MKRNSSLLNMESILSDDVHRETAFSASPTQSEAPQTAPMVFHRRMVSNDSGLLPRQKSTSSFFDYPASASNNLFYSSPLDVNPRYSGGARPDTDYYQQLLVQEADYKNRLELQNFLYSNPPTYEAPPLPSESAEDSEEEEEEAKEDDRDIDCTCCQHSEDSDNQYAEHLKSTQELQRFLDAETTTFTGRTLANELRQLVFETPTTTDTTDVNTYYDNAMVNSPHSIPQITEPQVAFEMVEEKINNQTTEMIDQPLTLKIKDFGISMDENCHPGNQMVSSSEAISPRSSSEPPAARSSKRSRKFAGKRHKLPKDPNTELVQANVDDQEEENANAGYPLFLCSPSVSDNNQNLSPFGHSLEEASPVYTDLNVVTMRQSNVAEVQQEDEERRRSADIQSRPLPPLPLDDDVPGEPEDEAPEPAYESIPDHGDGPYEAVFHQRSVSDHILNMGKAIDDEKIKKSNSDRTERRSTRTASTTQHDVILAEIPEKKLSIASKDARNLSCSSPSIAHEKPEETSRLRSTTTDSSTIGGEEDTKGNRPRLITSSEVGTVKLRDPSFCIVEQQKHRSKKIRCSQHSLLSPVPGSPTLSNPAKGRFNDFSTHPGPQSLSSLRGMFMSKRQASEPQIQMGSKLSPKEEGSKLSPKESVVRKSFKWKNFIPRFKSNSEQGSDAADVIVLEKSQSVLRSPSTPSSSGSSNGDRCSVKLRTSHLKEDNGSLKLCTLDENPITDSSGCDQVDGAILDQICQAPKVTRKSLERPWRGFFTRSFYGHLPKKPELEIENVSPTMSEREAKHARRVSVIGDVECDRRMFAPSPEANEKLDNMLRRQFGEKQLKDSFDFSSDDEGCKADQSACSNKAVIGDRKRVHRLSSKTLPRQKRGILGTPVKFVVKDEPTYATISRKSKGIQKRKQRKDMIQRRKSWHQIIVETINLDDVPDAGQSQIVVRSDKLPRQAKSSAEFYTNPPGTLKRKKLQNKRFMSSSAVGDVNKQVLKSEKEKKSSTLSFANILSIRGRKKSKDSRNLNNVYSSFNGSPNSATYPVKRDCLHQLNESDLPDALEFLKDDSSYTGSDGTRTPGFNSSSHGEFFAEPYPVPLLEKPKWEDLNLWGPEPETWSLKHPNEKLSSSENKRQNIIYELYMTEKHHCQVIVFFQQAYQVGLRTQNLLTDDQLASVIPDVLDSLLDFHLRLLRRMKERRESSVIVETVSDIVAEEFSCGPYTNAAIGAYTSFCISRDESCQAYSDLMDKNSRVKKFFDFYEHNPNYKKRDFKSCFLLIAQRITKYNVLFKEILKNDPLKLKPKTKAALTGVEEFTRRIDSEMKNNEINKSWETLKKNLEFGCTGRLLKRVFTYDDLVHQRNDNPRVVLAIGKVYYVNMTQSKPYKVELTMVLFDDILVLFAVKGTKLVFFKDISSVIPLKFMIAREVERTTDMRLIITAIEKPDMYLLSFTSKTELRNWIAAIHSAQLKAPGNARFAPGKPVADDNAAREEETYNRQVVQWESDLERTFNELKNNESLIYDYMTTRMRLFDKVREHFKRFPVKHSLGSVSRHSLGFNERRDQKQFEKTKLLVESKFKELREYRRKKLDELAEVAQKARDNDLLSYFDDLHDVSHPTPSSSGNESSTSGEFLDEPGSSNRPRRVKTYHGIVDSQHRGSIRRHTTVPKMKSSKLEANTTIFETSDDEDDLEAEVDREINDLPLSMSTKSRKAATQLIEENVKLRMENNRFKSEIAMQELHIASLKSRKTAVIETSEKLESLRQKQEEIIAQDHRLKQDHENFKEEYRQKVEELERRQAEIKVREAEVEAKMKYSNPETFRSGACVLQDYSLESKLGSKSLVTTSSPHILSLANKSEFVKKKR